MNRELEEQAKNFNGAAGVINVQTKQYMRNPYVAEYAKRRANGICQLCLQPAPFNSKNGGPYLESHHIIWLSLSGQDSIKSTVDLCPNCRRKMHILDLAKDKERLSKSVADI